MAMDRDDGAVGSMYEQAASARDAALYCLVMDLARPSPRLGFAHTERASLLDRGPADLVLALGLVHHLRFDSMLPLDMQYEYFSRIGKHVLLEWIPPSDQNVQRMIAGTVRETFSYSDDEHNVALRQHFEVLRETKVGESGRVLYMLRSLVSS